MPPIRSKTLYIKGLLEAASDTTDDVSKRNDDARRTRTKATTIGAIDCDQRERAGRRKRRQKFDARANREKAGAAPHSKPAAATQPWIKKRISRATFYRQQRAAP